MCGQTTSLKGNMSCPSCIGKKEKINWRKEKRRLGGINDHGNGNRSTTSQKLHYLNGEKIERREKRGEEW